MVSEGGLRGYWELLNTAESGEVFSQRARSASDAAVLRRKGHLKEQDRLIDFMRRMHETHTCEEVGTGWRPGAGARGSGLGLGPASGLGGTWTDCGRGAWVMLKMERWIAEHRQDPKRSRLRRLIPGIGTFFTPLKLVEAFREYDAFFALSRRKYIPPNFAELRHVVNIAQVHASADTLKLITFDADGTLYADGAHMEQDNQMIAHIINLMRSNVQVAIVTAAGYPGEPDKFEKRVMGLLEAFRKLKLSPEVTSRFHIMGGECNYLLRVRPDDKRLEFVPDNEWKTATMQSWREDDIVALLDEGEAMLQEGAKRLNLAVNVIRKNRAVGIVPTQPTIYEVLEDIALTIQTQLVAKVPFCAFNGGNDVFVDVGNKLLGLEALMRYLQVSPPEVLHVGDRFTDSGNDVATRDICSVLWVANPEETGFFIKMLLKDIRKSRWQPYIE
ncbi:hypothetical protein HXX76_014015 [Chlamydomonas incerta]|uniref:IMP-specific 5'-nucleotidase 1 n=1 Tax=Chlamydomonas incerta TaxID=51695 RepID=A0A835SSI3_CHLIN|nr:hypothetical protein HXX76_014015 [Chlamydomonas incerta]|eukprot:KAG2425106.1 hypothetical protein HXX76_014015 [Chlamydomonas incerta]